MSFEWVDSGWGEWVDFERVCGWVLLGWVVFGWENGFSSEWVKVGFGWVGGF